MRTGVLLINLGTPESPSTADVRKYLRQFFSDPFVFDIVPWKRWLLRNLIILPFRSPRSAALYKQIWTERGSPLLFNSQDLQNALQAELGNDFHVELGMGYGSPSITSALKNLKHANIDKLVVMPMFPQRASSTTSSVLKGFRNALTKVPIDVEVKTIECFYDQPQFIAAWGARVNQYDSEKYDRIIFSYHGLPERHILKDNPGANCLEGDCCSTISPKNSGCYRAQCFATSRMIAKEIGLQPGSYSIAFQSRFGRTPWIKPYLEDTLKQLAADGAKEVLVISPSFVADCLETVYEIAIEYAGEFKQLGGERLELVPSLNAHKTWVVGLCDILKSKNELLGMGD